jgi:hypothetical protein
MTDRAPRTLCSDIERLWKLAEQRYVADGPAALAAIGPSYSQWQDFPDDTGQARVYGNRGANCTMHERRCCEPSAQAVRRRCNCREVASVLHRLS